MTSEQIKQALALFGHSSLKRASKSKDTSGNICRVFISPNITLTVTTSPCDSFLLDIKSSISAPLQNKSSLRPLNQVTIVTFLQNVPQRKLNEVTDFLKNKHVHTIKQIPSVVPNEMSSTNYLLVSPTETFHYQTYYCEAIDISKFKKVEEPLTGICVDPWGDDIDCTWDIPTGSFLLHYYPEYQQIIALSSDLSSGICSYEIPEADVLTFKNSIADKYDLLLEEDTSLFKKKIRKYDIINISN